MNINLLKRPPFCVSKFIPDPEMMSFLSNIEINSDMISDYTITPIFLENFYNWIVSSKNNKFIGIDNFSHKVFAQGSTEVFDKFYIRHSNRRFRVWRGDYAYHKIMFSSTIDWQFLDDNPIDSNDAIIISIPFANTGSNYKFEHTMRIAEKLNVPVLVDCCWFGTCGDLTFDFSYHCIKEISFSLSKTFPIPNLRVGMRLSREHYDDDGLFVYKKDHYTNFLSQHIGNSFINKFSSDYLFNLYRKKQIKLCKMLAVKPSNVVSLATGDDWWVYLNRGGPSNRLSFPDLLVKGDFE